MNPRMGPAIRTAMVPVAVAAFVVLGLGESGLGTAWPAMRRSLDRPVHDLGTLLALGLAAYALSSALTGRIHSRLGTGHSLVVAAAMSLAGLTTYALAPTWLGVIGAALLLGLGSGVLDSTLNAHGAHHFTAGAMNLLHAGFGVGATLGPIVMATAVSRNAGWQAGYAVYAVIQGAMLIVLVVVRRRWRPAPVRATATSAHRRLDTVVVASLALFFLYTGIEVAAGQWAFSVITEDRGWGTQAGGAWVAAYWGGLTVGRLALSAIADRLGSVRVLRWSMAGSLVTTAWFWWDPAGLGVIGLPALGCSLAGVFPTLVTLTPHRLGPARTTAMVGYQLAAASLGAAGLPWLAGRLVAASSLGVVAPFLFAMSIAMVALNHALQRWTEQVGGGGVAPS